MHVCVPSGSVTLGLCRIPANTKHLYNICTVLDQRENVGPTLCNFMQMFCVCRMLHYIVIFHIYVPVDMRLILLTKKTLLLKTTQYARNPCIYIYQLEYVSLHRIVFVN